MINFDDYANENKIEHNLNWPYIPDHTCRIIIIGGSGFEKTNALLYYQILINYQILIKYICTRKIHMKININFRPIKEKT